MRTRIAITLALWLLCHGAHAQQDVRGTAAVSDGQRYVVGFPRVMPIQDERPLPRPLKIYITSAFECTVRVFTPARSNDGLPFDKVVAVRPGTATIVDVASSLLPTASEQKTGYGIELMSDRPIDVWTSLGWESNGEMIRHFPVWAWGTNYMTLNYHQDRFGFVERTVHYRPSGFLIIASEDETVVTYVPTVTTEGGPDQPSVAARTAGSVTLQRGETMYVSAAINKNSSREPSTDLTGTVVASNKPVAVISGHTKVAIHDLPDVIPAVMGGYGRDASFVRNCVYESLLPTSHGGTSFVTVPVMYSPTRKTGVVADGLTSSDDRGDVIRFLALENDTKISRMRADGSALRAERTLMRGESFMDHALEVPVYWETDKPVIAVQYGKAWAYIAPPGSASKDGEETQGGPNVSSGKPMMQIVPPTDRWVSRSSFYALESHDNFVSVVLKHDQASMIMFDGVSITAGFSNSMRRIAGTPYSIIRFSCASGYHELRSAHDSVKWCAWSYGSMDGDPDGRAYGSPVAVDLTQACADSVAIDHVVGCGNVTGAAVVTSTASCGSVASVFAEELQNYTMTTEPTLELGASVPFQLTLRDPDMPARAVVRVISTSGRFLRRTYTYDPQRLASDTSEFVLPPIATNQRQCTTMVVTNPSSSVVDVLELGMTTDRDGVTFEPSTFMLAPGASQTVDICIQHGTPFRSKDTIVARTSCRTIRLANMSLEVVEPCIIVSQQTWVNIPASSPGVEKAMEIRNVSKVPVTILDYDRAALQPPSKFVQPRYLDEMLPITLAPGSGHTWYVKFAPNNTDTVTHTQDVAFITTATCSTTVSRLIGTIATSVSDVEDHPALRLAPNPTDDVLIVHGLDPTATVQVVNMQGEPTVIPTSSRLDVSALPPGTYMLRVMQGGRVMTARFMVVR